VASWYAAPGHVRQLKPEHCIISQLANPEKPSEMFANILVCAHAAKELLILPIWIRKMDLNTNDPIGPQAEKLSLMNFQSAPLLSFGELTLKSSSKVSSVSQDQTFPNTETCRPRTDPFLAHQTNPPPGKSSAAALPYSKLGCLSDTRVPELLN